MIFNSYSRAFLVILGVFFVFLYSLYEKRKTADYLKSESEKNLDQNHIKYFHSIENFRKSSSISV